MNQSRPPRPGPPRQAGLGEKSGGGKSRPGNSWCRSRISLRKRRRSSGGRSRQAAPPSPPGNAPSGRHDSRICWRICRRSSGGKSRQDACAQAPVTPDNRASSRTRQARRFFMNRQPGASMPTLSTASPQAKATNCKRVCRQPAPGKACYHFLGHFSPATPYSCAHERKRTPPARR